MVLQSHLKIKLKIKYIIKKIKNKNKKCDEVDLVACNGRTFVMAPEWTRIRPGLKQKSIIDYIITDMQMLKKSGKLCVDTTDIGISDHFLLWLELGRLTKRHTKGISVS